MECFTTLINIFPNPAQQQVTVEENDKFRSVQVLNATGKLLRDVKINNQYQVNIKLAGLVNGIYLLGWVNDKEIQIIKLIIRK